MIITRSRQGSVSALAALPTFEQVFNGQQRRPLLTLAAKRLRWVLDGPLESAITIFQQPYHEPGATPEPYCTGQGSASDGLTRHAVAQAAYTEPKVSSINVSVTQIDDWEDQWRETHLGCADPTSDGEDEENYDFPSECCGEQRPHPQDMTLTVRASGQFVTVHDYVSAVHPWLLRKQDDLLRALAVLTDEPRLSLPAGSHLMVTFGGPDLLSVGTEEEWLRNKDKDTYLQMVAQQPQPAEQYPLPPGWPKGRSAFVRMAPNGDMGEMPVDKDGNYVELRSPEEMDGPWPGYVGKWPPPYTGMLATLDLSHEGVFSHLDNPGQSS